MPRNRKPSKSAQVMGQWEILVLILLQFRKLDMGPRKLLGLRQVNSLFNKVILTCLPNHVWWVWTKLPRACVANFFPAHPKNGKKEKKVSGIFQLNWISVIIFLKIMHGFPINVNNLPMDVRKKIRAWKRWRKSNLSKLQEIQISEDAFRKISISPPESIVLEFSKRSLGKRSSGRFIGNSKKIDLLHGEDRLLR